MLAGSRGYSELHTAITFSKAQEVTKVGTRLLTNWLFVHPAMFEKQ